MAASTDDEHVAMSTLLAGDADQFSTLTEELLNVLSRSSGRIDALSLAKRQEHVARLLTQLDTLETQVRSHVALAELHRKDHERITKLRRDVALRERRTQAAIEHLSLCSRTLSDVCTEGERQLAQIEQAQSRMFSSYASSCVSLS